MKKHYRVVGTLSEIKAMELVDFDEQNKAKVNNKKLKMIIASALATIICLTIQDTSYASELITTGAPYKAPSQLQNLLQFVNWLVELLRLIVSSIAGLICTFAGYKWATAVESNGQEAAKKILKNAFVGGLVVWTGTSIADFFIGKMNDILL